MSSTSKPKKPGRRRKRSSYTFQGKKNRRATSGGAAFEVKAQKTMMAEMVECRRCLGIGLRRDCCQEYYCDQCYYDKPNCPNCNSPVVQAGGMMRDKLGRVQQSADTTDLQFICGFLCKGCVLLFFLVIPWLVLGIEQATVELTVHGLQCQAPFGRCNKELCRLMYREVNGSGAPNTSFYDPSLACETVTDTIALANLQEGPEHVCVCSLACVVDSDVYTRTHGRVGLDFCDRTFNALVPTLRDDFEPGSDPLPRIKLNQWSLPEYANTRQDGRASAFFDAVYNAAPSSICGTQEGDSALIFTGEVFRWAETTDVNLVFGGRIDFYLKYGGGRVAQEGLSTTEQPCYVVYDGRLTLSYSVDGGTTWGLIKEYGMEYQKTSFTRVEQELPPASWTNATRFRWEVVRFENDKDFIAMDNITILTSAVPQGWKDESNPVTAAIKKGVEEASAVQVADWPAAVQSTQEAIANAQCCMGSPGCPSSRGGHRAALRQGDEDPAAACNQPDFKRIVGAEATTVMTLSAGQHAIVFAAIIWVLRLLWMAAETRGETTSALYVRSCGSRFCPRSICACCFSRPAGGAAVHPPDDEKSQGEPTYNRRSIMGFGKRRRSTATMVKDLEKYQAKGPEASGSDNTWLSFRTERLRRWLAERDREVVRKDKEIWQLVDDGKLKREDVDFAKQLDPEWNHDMVKVLFPTRLDDRWRKKVFVALTVVPVAIMVLVALSFIGWGWHPKQTAFSINLYEFHDFFFRVLSDKAGRQNLPWAAGDSYEEILVQVPLILVICAAVALDVAVVVTYAVDVVAVRQKWAPQVHIRFCTKPISNVAHMATDALVITSETTRRRRRARRACRGTHVGGSEAEDAMVIRLEQIVETGDILLHDRVAVLAGSVFSAQPFACLSLLAYEMTGASGLGYVLGTILCIRTLGGPFAFAKLGLLLAHILDFRCIQHETFALACCTRSCFRLGGVCCCVGLAAAGIGLGTFAVLGPTSFPALLAAPHINSQFLALWFSLLPALFCLVGFTVAFANQFAVQPLLYLTTIEHSVVFVKYQSREHCCFREARFGKNVGRFCSLICRRHSFVCVSVDDASDFKDYLRSQPPPKYTQDELATMELRENLEGELDPKDLADVQLAFGRIDENNSGGITIEELDEWLQAESPVRVSKDELSQGLTKCDENGDLIMDYLEFLSMIHRSRTGGDALGDTLLSVLGLKLPPIEGHDPKTQGKKEDWVTSITDLPPIPPDPETHFTGGKHEALVVIDLTTIEDEAEEEKQDPEGPYICQRPWCRQHVDPQLEQEARDAGRQDCTFHPGHRLEVGF